MRLKYLSSLLPNSTVINTFFLSIHSCFYFSTAAGTSAGKSNTPAIVHNTPATATCILCTRPHLRMDPYKKLPYFQVLMRLRAPGVVAGTCLQSHILKIFQKLFFSFVFPQSQKWRNFEFYSSKK